MTTSNARGVVPIEHMTVHDSQVLVLSRAAVPALVKAGHLDREWGARMKKMYRARKKENASKMYPVAVV